MPFVLEEFSRSMRCAFTLGLDLQAGSDLLKKKVLFTAFEKIRLIKCPVFKNIFHNYGRSLRTRLKIVIIIIGLPYLYIVRYHNIFIFVIFIRNHDYLLTTTISVIW